MNQNSKNTIGEGQIPVDSNLIETEVVDFNINEMMASNENGKLSQIVCITCCVVAMARQFRKSDAKLFHHTQSCVSSIIIKL